MPGANLLRIAHAPDGLGAARACAVARLIKAASAADPQVHEPPPDVPEILLVAAAPASDGPGAVAAARALVKSGRAEIAVHGYQDVPPGPAAGLRVAAVLRRGDPRDGLLARGGRVLAYLPPGARILVDTTQRRAQLLRRRSDLAIDVAAATLESLVGALDRGQVDAVVAPAADVTLVGMAQRLSERFDADLLIPGVGQAVMALEAHLGGRWFDPLLAPLHDEHTAFAMRAERACLSRLAAPSDAPIAVHASTDGEVMAIHGIVATPDGRHAARLRWQGPWREADEVGTTLAELLLAAGAREILSGQPLVSTGRYSFRVDHERTGERGPTR